MTYRVIIQPIAMVEMREAYLWIARDSSRAAARWYNGLERAIETLAENPGRCPLAPESEYFKEEIRELFYGKRGGVYRILFTISEDTVSVLYVRHGARDYVRPGRAPEDGENQDSDA
jgi:plasmid stabilization system protein ParE